MDDRHTEHLPVSRWRTTAGVVATMIGLLLTLVSLPAAAVTIGPGSITGFEIEGNQVDAGSDPAIDWQTAVAAGNVRIFSDDSLDSGQHGKEQDPSGWTCNNGGGSPGKDNILDVAISSRVSPAGAFLDLAYRRAAGNGNAHINFEFNQNPVSLNCPGLTGRTDGDLLLLFNFPGSGTASVEVYRWDNTPPADVDGDQNPADGAWIFTSALPVGVANGAENTATIADADEFLFGVASIGARQFGEASLNLGQILGEGQPGNGSCTRFGSVSVRSRSSGESITSELQDRLGPEPVDLSTCGQITVHKVDDASPGNPLAGATFGLYATLADATARVSSLATCVSDDDGSCVFPEVDPGTYFVAEISAPPGYDRDPDVVGPIVVAFRQQVDIAAPFVDPRQVGFVRIDKVLVDAGGDPLTPDSLADLNGATFELHQEDLVASVWPDPPVDDPATCEITNSQGFCTIGPVPIGTYEVVETVAPPGTTPGTQPADVVVTQGTVAQAVVATYPNVSETPTIDISKSATPTAVDEPGGPVVFDLLVTNTSLTETLTIDSLVDDVFGDLTAAAVTANTCDDLVGTTVAAQQSVPCSFTADVLGGPGDQHHDTVEVTATDDEGQQATASDDAFVNIRDLTPAITVTKDASPTEVAEPGAAVTFTVGVQNTSTVDTVTITSMVDTVFGDLLDVSNAGVTGNTCLDLTAADRELLPLEELSCTFVAFVGDDAVVGDTSEHEDTVTASGIDDDENPVSGFDDATVDILDALPVVVVEKSADPTSVDEGAPRDVDFTVVVTNDSGEPVTIVSFDDSVFAGVAGDADCQVGTVLAPGGSCSFTFTRSLTGEPGETHLNTFTVVVRDDELNTDDDDDDATVTFDDLPSSLVVDKSADPGSVNEPGATVDFAIAIQNTSATDDVTIDSIVDDVFGDLGDAGNASVVDNTCPALIGTTLEPGDSASCTFAAFIGPDAGGGSDPEHHDTVSVTGTDDDDGQVSGSDDATVDIVDELPLVTVDKAPAPSTVPEGTPTPVTFTVTVTNGAAEPATITSLVDDVFGVLDGDADCQVGTVLPVGGSCQFGFTRTLTGDAGVDHENTVTVVVTDGDGNEDDGTAPAVVPFTDVPPTVVVGKDSDTTSLTNGQASTVTFTVTVTNSSVEPVTIQSLVDSVFGTLVGDADCQVGTVLPVAGSCTFSFTRSVTGSAAGPHANVVTVVVVDDEGTTGSGNDDETIPSVALPTEVLPQVIARAPVQQPVQELPRTGAEVFPALRLAAGLLVIGIGLLLLDPRSFRRRWLF